MTNTAKFTLLLAILGITQLAGCSLPGKPQQAIQHYVLSDPGPVAASATPHPKTLLIRDMEAAPFYQDTPLAFSRTPGTRGQYQYARWSEPPPRRLAWLLRQRLETARTFAVVAPLGSGIQGDYQLNTRLVDFFHDAATAPGTTLVVLEAELVRRGDAALAGRRMFVAQVPAASYDAAGAADALEQGANQVMDELTAWLAESQLP